MENINKYKNLTSFLKWQTDCYLYLEEGKFHFVFAHKTIILVYPGELEQIKQVINSGIKIHCTRSQGSLNDFLKNHNIQLTNYAHESEINDNDISNVKMLTYVKSKLEDESKKYYSYRRENYLVLATFINLILMGNSEKSGNSMEKREILQELSKYDLSGYKTMNNYPLRSIVNDLFELGFF